MNCQNSKSSEFVPVNHRTSALNVKLIALKELHLVCVPTILYRLPFKVALSPVAAIMQSVIRCQQLHPKVELCLPLQVTQVTNCPCADPSRWQHDPDTVTQLQVHGRVGYKDPVRPMGRPPRPHAGGGEGFMPVISQKLR